MQKRISLPANPQSRLPNPLAQNGNFMPGGSCMPAVAEPMRSLDSASILLEASLKGDLSKGRIEILVRKILEVSNTDPLTEQLEGKPLADHLLEPTRIYVKNILSLIEQVDVHAIAHLTGGGFWENIPRVLPDNTQAVIDEKSWQWPAVFSWLQQAGNVSRFEMYRTFNCGVGMVIALSPADADKAIALMEAAGEKAWKLGVIKASEAEERVVING